MEKIRLGRTNLMVTRSGFGALPIQRLSKEEAAAAVRADLTFHPAMAQCDRQAALEGWHRAVERSRGWAKPEGSPLQSAKAVP